jgi:hypothetical protein
MAVRAEAMRKELPACLAATLPSGDGGYGQGENKLPVKKHQAPPLELFEDLLDTFGRQPQI